MTCGAIQTDVYGLAPTYCLRAWVGGNENPASTEPLGDTGVFYEEEWVPMHP